MINLQIENQLDEIDMRILNVLQQDARLSYSEIGRRVNMSQPTVAERVRRLEDAGVIRGYHADIDPVKIGRNITAFIRLRIGHPSNAQYKLEDFMRSELPEVCECHRISGDDCLLVKVQVSSIAALNELLGRINVYGNPNTAIVLSTAIERKTIEGIWGD